MKRCSRCGRAKPLTDFWRDGRASDGLRSACKPCLAESIALYESAHRDWRLAWDRQNAKRMNAKYPLKYRARQVLNRALRKGHIVKGECQRQGPHRGRIEAHHHDYNQPLAVEWVCLGHHREIDKEK